jgi:hypothetical protein
MSAQAFAALFNWMEVNNHGFKKRFSDVVIGRLRGSTGGSQRAVSA